MAIHPARGTRGRGFFHSRSNRTLAMHRLTMHLRHSSKDNRWHLYAGTRHLKSFDRKCDGEQAGRERGNQEYMQGGEARLVVHRADGTIELQYTYVRPRTLYCPAVPVAACPLVRD